MSSLLPTLAWRSVAENRQGLLPWKFCFRIGNVWILSQQKCQVFLYSHKPTAQNDFCINPSDLPACWMPASELHESSHTEGCNQMMFLWCPWDKSSISSFKWAHYRKHIHDIQMHISVIIIWVCLTSSVPWLSVSLSNVCLLKFKNETLSGSTINDSIITLLYSSNPNQMLVFRFMLPSSGSSSSKVCSLSVR